MNTVKRLAIMLVVGGLGLVYGFTYTGGTYEARLGSIELSIKGTQAVSKGKPMNSGQPNSGMCPFFLTGKPQGKTIRIHHEHDSADNGEQHGKLI